MSWRSSAWRKEGAEFACYRGPGCQPGRHFLDLDERRCATGDARLVEAAGAATLAVGYLHQVTWDGAFGDSGRRYEKAVTDRLRSLPKSFAIGTWRRR